MSEEVKEEPEAEEKPVRAAVTPVIKLRAEKAVGPVRRAVKPERRAVQPAKKVPQNVHAGSVKSKIAAIQKAADKIYSGARTIQTGINEQMKVNQGAIAAMQSGVNEQMNENQASVAAMQSGVNEQMNENQEYVKRFFG